MDTLPETNIAPENWWLIWLEYYFPFGKAYFQGWAVSFRDGKCNKGPESITYSSWSIQYDSPEVFHSECFLLKAMVGKEDFLLSFWGPVSHFSGENSLLNFRWVPSDKLT